MKAISDEFERAIILSCHIERIIIELQYCEYNALS